MFYRHVDAALVRAVAHPSGLVVPPRPEISGNTGADVERWRNWIEQVWAQQVIAEAVEVASPVLAGRIRAVCAGDIRKPKHVCRTGFSLARYVLRLQHRATPFGLFAGIAPAHIGEESAVRWGDNHRPVARVDSVWLAEVIVGLEACPDLLRRLPVVTETTCLVRGDRLVVPCQRPSHDSQNAPAEASVRYTRAVRTVVSAASASVAVGDLVGKLVADYPDTATETIEALVVELVTHRILLTSLRPPMTVTNPLDHVLDQLDAVDAEAIPAVAPTVGELREIRKALARHTDAAPEERGDLRASATERMATLSGTAEQPVTIDTRLNCSLTLPRQVAREAERAADCLARLAPFPAGSPTWRDYHSRFVERYGTDALVPVLQLIDPDLGLDFPAGYRGSLLPRPESGMTARDEQLLQWAQRAAVDDAREIVLTDADADKLAQGQEPARVPHIDLCFHLQAPTHGALQRGEFTLAVAGLAPAAGATAGRFLPLLENEDRERMASAYRSLAALDGSAVRAQVSSPPLHVRTENVSRVPALRPEMISVSEHRGDRTLPLDDLAVGADADRLYLVSLSSRQHVEPTAMSAVELVNFTHPLIRLLCELPRAHAATVGPFSWGAARGLPFLPRVRYGRAVLAPATWRITTTDLASAEAGLQRWHESLRAWQQRWGLPDAVHLGSGDQRLRLDLHRSADAQLLRTELERAGHASLSEAPDEAAEYGWFDGRAHEITLTLASTATDSSSIRTGSPAVISRDHGHLPGDTDSEWAFVKLYAHPDRHTEILTHHVPELLGTFDQPPRWWFVRYNDPQPHLRLRLHTPDPDSFTHDAARLGTWTADLRQRGLIGRVQWDTYYPEIGRYGTGTTMAAAEAVFVADSAACLTQLALTARDGPPPQAVTAGSLMDLAISFLGDTATGTRWLIEHITTASAPHPDRVIHREAMRLAQPGDSFAALRELPGGDRITAAWAARREALATYRAHLAVDEQKQPESILPSLMHMHHLRTVGLDANDERACYRLARSAALAWRARHHETTS